MSPRPDTWENLKTSSYDWRWLCQHPLTPREREVGRRGEQGQEKGEEKGLALGKADTQPV